MKNFDLTYSHAMESDMKIELQEESLLNILKYIEENGESIGEGRTANVLILDREEFDRMACLKIMSKNIKETNGVLERRLIFVNDLEAEMDLLDKMHSAGLAVPKPICSIKNSEGNDYLLMEEINGFSVEHLKTKRLYDELPEDFNIYDFLDKLKEIIEKMHDLRVYHRDLHWGNIMVDKNGNPVIIDFGHAIKNPIGDPYVHINPVKNIRTNFADDDYASSSLFQDIAPYLKANGYDFKSAKEKNKK